MPESKEVGRRDFVRVVMAALGSIMGAVIGIPAIGYLISPATRVQKKEAWIPLGPLENYPVGIPTLFSFTRTKVNGWEKTVNSYGAYVARSTEDEFKVYSNICTHLSCRVTWHEDQEEYICPCHDGRFDSVGQVVTGPPPEPLHEFETKVEDGNLFIHFVEG